MGENFEKRNLEGAVFHDVNLKNAIFNDVSLMGASIRNANLKDFSIDDAYIEGMTVRGLRIDILIEEELDRRDPERVNLRMVDMFDPQSVRKVMKRLDEVREMFFQTLRTTQLAKLVQKPASDQWAVIEIVRHLVFAEDMYINRWILRNDKPWTKLGLLSSFIAKDGKFAAVGSEPTNNLEAVLAAWKEVHRATQEFVVGVTAEQLRQSTKDVDFGQGMVGRVLQGMAQHDLNHIRDAEALIAKTI